MKFEFTSLRQQVSTAEKRCGFPLKIAENPRNSASFAPKPDSEKVSYWTQEDDYRGNWASSTGGILTR
jgi:hypothetical protein